MKITGRAWVYGFMTESVLVLIGLSAVLSGTWSPSGASNVFASILYWTVLFFHLPSFVLWFLWDFLGSDWAPLFYGYLLSVFILQSLFFSILWNMRVSKKLESRSNDEFAG